VALLNWTDETSWLYRMAWHFRAQHSITGVMACVVASIFGRSCILAFFDCPISWNMDFFTIRAFGEREKGYFGFTPSFL